MPNLSDYWKLLASLTIGVVLMTGGCKRENPTTGGSGNAIIPFSTLIVRQEVPDTLGALTNTISDAVMLDDGSLLLVIGFSLYHYKDGTYTLRVEGSELGGIILIERTSDSRIFLLGSNDELYSSSDNGVTFTKQERFVARLGQEYAQDLYFNGNPDHMLVRKLADNSYILWLYNHYEYNPGGTGFPIDRFRHFVFSSSDGTNWTLQYSFMGGATFYPTAIDNDGKIFITEVSTYSGSYQKTYRFLSSTDYGHTQTEIAEGDVANVNAISRDNAYYRASRISGKATDPENMTPIYKWVRKKWKLFIPTIDEKFKQSFFNNDFTAQRIHFTPTGKMLLVSNQGVVVADKKF